MSDHIPHDALVLTGSGYQEQQKLHTKTVLLPKRRRKVLLTPKQKKHNTYLPSKRILIEHFFAQLKKFKILDFTYRNLIKKLHFRLAPIFFPSVERISSILTSYFCKRTIIKNVHTATTLYYAEYIDLFLQKCILLAVGL